MSEMDELLQQKLVALEKGAAPEAVLQDLPAGADELKPLITLAAEVRETPHPQPSPEHIRVLQYKILSEAKELSRNRVNRSRGSSFTWIFATGLAGATFLCVFAVIALVGVGLWPRGSNSSQTATLVDVIGQVEVASPVGSWQPLADGDKIESGQRMRVGSQSNATLVFFEGSRTTVDSNSELVFTHLGGSRSSGLQVEIDQTSGKTSHSVVPLGGSSSTFVVDTPAGAATVRGTTFSVTVIGEQALFTVDKGEVTVSNADRKVSVAAGQATLSRSNEAPAAPAYRFALNDQLASINGDQWVFPGVSFQVMDETIITGNPQIGDNLLVQGRIIADQWVADSVEPSFEDGEQFEFTGVVEQISAESWLINSVSVLVNEVTEMDDGIAVGDTVKVIYTLLKANRWLALEIERLEVEDESSPTSTDTPAGTLTPVATVVNCTGNERQPKAETLAQTYGVTYEEIMSWFCQGFGFGEIDLAYGLSRETGHTVADIFALRRMGLGWGEIKRRALLTPTATATITTTVTATITPTFTATPPLTVTVTPTSTMTPTPTLTPTITPTPAATQVTDCTGANPQPKGQKLAELYGVPYEEIMGWFCQGFGFGEIDLAYSLSAQTGTPVDQIFAMKSSGMGWGEIKKQLTGDNKENKKPKKP
jgi:hypothetical protein